MMGIRIRALRVAFFPHRRRNVRCFGDTGSVSVETLLVLPLLLVIVAVLVAAGWVASAQGAVRSAANEAARAASLARTSDHAQSLATTAATTTLNNSDLRCDSPVVQMDASGFSVPVGQAAQVSVTVSCEVPLARLGVPGLGNRTVTATGTSVLDTYRERP